MGFAQILAIVKFIIANFGTMKELYLELMKIVGDHPAASPEAAQCALGNVINACKPSTGTTPAGTQQAPLRRRGGIFRIFRRRG